jgi:type VI secretion system secreted protein Hcp
MSALLSMRVSSKSAAALIAASFVMILLALTFLTAPSELTSVPTASAASVDYFLKIDGIDGESTADGHKGEIELESWSWGESNPSTVGPGGSSSGRAVASPLTITKSMDKATPKLMFACASGTHFPEAVLYARDPKGTDRMKLTLQQVSCSSFSSSGGGQPLPMEEISMNFGKIKVEYIQLGQKGDLTHSAGWDFIENRSW